MTHEGMIKELRGVWDSVGEDALQAAEYDVEFDGAIGYDVVQDTVASNAQLYLHDEYRQYWKLCSFEEQSILLDEAFPIGTEYC